MIATSHMTVILQVAMRNEWKTSNALGLQESASLLKDLCLANSIMISASHATLGEYSQASEQ
jgi:hypothetical protein